MRRILHAIVAALAVTAANASAQTPIERRFAARPDGWVRIANLAGTVKVTGWDRDSVVVTGTVEEPPGAAFYLGYGEEGVKLGIWTDEPVSNLRPSVLEIRVPRASRVFVRSGSADIDIAGLTGGLDVNSVTGRIVVNGALRELRAESFAGPIEISGASANVSAKTAGGAITLRGVRGIVVATTVTGDLGVMADSIERGTFESVDGDVRFAGTIGRGSAIDVVSHGGTIEFSLPPRTSADFAISMFHGPFEDRFGVKPAYGGNKLNGQEITFTIGSGGGQVSVRSFKGGVILSRLQ
jgi:hypothetical protein